jgi:hypothetical protein
MNNITFDPDRAKQLLQTAEAGGMPGEREIAEAFALLGAAVERIAELERELASSNRAFLDTLPRGGGDGYGDWEPGQRNW